MSKRINLLFGIIAAVLSLGIVDSFAEFEPYSENFEKYQTNAVYSDSAVTYTITCPEHPELGEAELNNSFIMNAAGGIYSGSDVYTGNAAENVCTYAKTGEKTLNAVFGGLGNGWHGRYSACMTELNGKGGVDAGFNLYNRRLAVDAAPGGGKALRMNPAGNTYIDTYSTYGDDDVELCENTLWSSDIYLKSVASNGSFEISLTEGSFSEPNYLQLSGIMQGRKSKYTLLRFDGEMNAELFGGAETHKVDALKWYTVEILLRLGEDVPKCVIVMRDRNSGAEIFTSTHEITGYSFADKRAGFDYCAASTTATKGETCAYVDNITVRSMDLTVSLVSSKAVPIGGGKTAISFNSDIDSSTITNDNITVFLGNEEVSNISLAQLSSKKVVITLPELCATSKYRIDTTGVTSVTGIKSKSSVYFKTGDLIAVSGAKRITNGVSVNVKNNSLNEQSIIVAVACENDGMLNKLVYKKVTLSSGALQGIEFIDIYDTPQESIKIYFISDINSPQFALTDALDI